MARALITPILFNYDFLEKLTQEATIILSLNLNNPEKYQQFKISIFLSFNRYLTDALFLLPDKEADDLLSRLTPAMENANELETLKVLNSDLDFFIELRKEFLNIIRSLKK